MSLKDAMTLSEMLKEVGPIGGYADGDYLGKCGECNRTFIGDKRARECLPCAVKNLNRWARHGKTVYDKAVDELARINQELGLDT